MSNDERIRKLTAERVMVMRAMYRGGGRTCEDIGRQFGVAKSTARSAIVGDTWSHVPMRAL